MTWLEGHLQAWSNDPASLGLASAQVASLAQSLDTTREDFTSVQTIRSQSKTVTQRFHASADKLYAEGADLIGTINAHANNSQNAPAVFNAAGITDRADPSPLPAPDQPSHMRATLGGTGRVTISWVGRGPTGTVYNVLRQPPGEASFTIVGQGSGRQKSFTDQVMPTGTQSATYCVQAVRGDQISPPSLCITVLFSAPVANETKKAA